MNITNYLNNVVLVIHAKRGNKLVEKFESRIVRLGELMRIAIPPELLKNIDIDEQTPVNMFVNESGNIEVEVQNATKGNTMCAICNHKEATKKCINCARHVCLSCFWAFGSLCKKCAKKV